MKKIISLLILIVVAAFGLTACLQEDGVADGNGVDSVNEATTVAVASTGDIVDSVDPVTTVDAVDAVDVVDAVDAVDPVDAGDTEAPDAQADTEDTDLAQVSDLADDGTRGPISILGNADFTSENGVVGGTGTVDDPYVIAGWEITVPSGEYYGVRIENVTAQFVLRGLIIQNATDFNGAGIHIGFASGGTIEGCSVSNSMHGIEVVLSTDLSIDNCILYVSGRGLRVVGESREQYRHEISTSNLYNNAAIYYFYGLDGDTISGLKGGHLTVADSRNVTVTNNEIVNGDGMTFAFVEDSTIALNLSHRTANVITDHGIHLYESHNNQVTTNVVKNNRLAGIQLTLSNNNSLVGNFAFASDSGIRILASDGNELRDNDIYADVTGIAILGGAAGNSIIANWIHDDSDHMAQGIALEAAFSNTIERNLVFGSEIGIQFEAQASGNTAANNTIVSGGYGMYMSGTNNTIERNLLAQHSRGILFPETFQRSITQGNTFRGNVLADNGNHVYTNLDSSGNTFTENVFLNEGQTMVADQGTGNVWTQNGVGNFWGFNAVVDADGDGIGDNPVGVYPADVDDIAPIAMIDARDLGLGIVGTLDLGTTTIETDDGNSIQVAAFVADEPNERATGFRGFPSELITGFPGILFVFDSEIESNFTMQTVPFDLDIVFFNAAGEWVGSTTMTAQATEQYTAGAPYQYALELSSGSLAELGIGPGSMLELP
jgi:parallel beta-helix repeat protein